MRILGLIAILSLAACVTVTHEVRAPDRPIEIALNIKIDQEIRVRLEEDAEELIENNPDLF